MDRTLLLLCAGLVFFTIVVLACAVFLPMNDKMYALFAGILGNFSGALFTYIRMSGGPPPPPAI